MSMGHYGGHMTEPLITGGKAYFVDPLLQAIVLTIKDQQSKPSLL
jgi:multicomponent Na+:H+ antiporter subunit C